jgi:hypothetical protein
MLKLHQYYEKVLQETDLQQIIEINIPGAGQLVSFDTDSLTSMLDVIGIALINPNPKTAGHGTLRLRIGDKEILPNEFHADLISKFSHKEVDAKVEFGFKEYIFPVETEAKGKPVRIEYTEPADGGSDKLYLYLLGSKDSNNICIPKYRFQILDFTVPQGNSDKDIELDIDSKTLQSHIKVVGAVFLGPSNRIKQVKLCVDETSVFPEGMIGQLVTKEIISGQTIGNGLHTKHIIPFTYMLQACDLKANSSKIEGKLVVTPNPNEDYKVFLYLLTTIE